MLIQILALKIKSKLAYLDTRKRNNLVKMGMTCNIIFSIYCLHAAIIVVVVLFLF